jgi:hypothetical protein
MSIAFRAESDRVVLFGCSSAGLGRYSFINDVHPQDWAGIVSLTMSIRRIGRDKVSLTMSIRRIGRDKVYGVVRRLIGGDVWMFIGRA